MPARKLVASRAALLGLVAIVAAAAGVARRSDGAGPAGDAVRGARVYAKCYACHSVEPGEHGLPGPNLRGVVGRRAGTLAGFVFSTGMVVAGRAGGLVWDDATLDRFLTDPLRVVPGTAMDFAGLRDPAERADLIAYLRGLRGPVSVDSGG